MEVHRYAPRAAESDGWPTFYTGSGGSCLIPIAESFSPSQSSSCSQPRSQSAAPWAVWGGGGGGRGGCFRVRSLSVLNFALAKNQIYSMRPLDVMEPMSTERWTPWRLWCQSPQQYRKPAIGLPCLKINKELELNSLETFPDFQEGSPAVTEGQLWLLCHGWDPIIKSMSQKTPGLMLAEPTRGVLSARLVPCCGQKGKVHLHFQHGGTKKASFVCAAGNSDQHTLSSVTPASSESLAKTTWRPPNVGNLKGPFTSKSHLWASFTSCELWPPPVASLCPPSKPMMC